MKVWFSIVFFLLISRGFSQEDFPSGNLQVLIDSTAFLYDSSKIYLFSSHDYTVSEGNWHNIDLNNDSLVDFIRSGRGENEPYYLTTIFLNDGIQFERVSEEYGKLLSIDSTKTVTIYQPTCCCEYFNVFSEFRFDFLGNLHHDDVYIHYDTHLVLDSTFYHKKLSGVLRSSPIVDDKEKVDPCSDSPLVGNQLLDVNNQLVEVLATRDDWYLVMILARSWQDDFHAVYYVGWVRE